MPLFSAEYQLPSTMPARPTNIRIIYWVISIKLDIIILVPKYY